jgi:formylglycine-generating enzyme required for sulfatase activity
MSAAEGLTPCYSCAGGVCDGVGNPYACDGYRLPTEAEWERGARGGLVGAAFPNGGSLLYAGDEYNCGGLVSLTDYSMLDEVAWYCGNDSGRTEVVAQLMPNGSGLYDVSGNVGEWCHDWYGGYPGAVTDPYGVVGGSDRVSRGGSWRDAPRRVRVAYRGWFEPSLRAYGFGLRLSRSSSP